MESKRLLSSILLGSSLLLGHAASHAAIVSTTGGVMQIAAPTSVAQGALESNTTIFAFDEGSSFGLESHFIHFDKVGTTLLPPVSVMGTVMFDAPIVGVLFAAPLLNFTDGLFGAAGTTYPTGNPVRGTTPPSDIFTVSGNLLTLNVDLVTIGRGIDQLRVLTLPTTVVPVPAALPLFLSALGFLGLLGHRRSKK